MVSVSGTYVDFKLLKDTRDNCQFMHQTEIYLLLLKTFMTSALGASLDADCSSFVKLNFQQITKYWPVV